MRTFLVLALLFVFASCRLSADWGETGGGAVSQVDSSECYAHIGAVAQSEWAEMSRVERAIVGMQAIRNCEGGGKR